MTTKPTILIVDDEPRMCDSLEVLLSSEGYETQTAGSGAEALACLAHHDVDLVLLDIVMPDMNGLEIMDHITEHRLDSLVIVITGHASIDSAVESLRKGAHDYLRKPFEFDELLKRVENAIEKKRLEREYEAINGKLQLSEKRYEYLVNNSPDIIYTLGPDGTFTYVNPACEKLLGYQAQEVIGKTFSDFVPKDRVSECNEVFTRMKNSLETIRDISCTLVHRDGSPRLFSLNGAPQFGSDGKMVGLVGILRDITERKKMEMQLAQAQKMQAIGTLAGGIAHDFNNLLMGIQGRTSLMFLNINGDHPHYEHLKGIENIVESGANLTRQLLGFARGGKYEVKPTDLNTLVQRSMEMFGRTKKDIVIHPALQQDIWTVEVDRGQIEQVLLNLYVNAWHAMPNGGDLFVETRNVSIPDQGAATYGINGGRYVRVQVKDTGVGMDETTQRRIFEPFFTTKEMGRGTGLGLASAYGIIKNHGGVINVSSAKGNGTTFHIFLPVSDKEIPKKQDNPETLCRGTESILLVDDEDMILEVGEEILREMGYKVFLARSGKEAVEVYKAHKGDIDMVILDMIMPDMGGGEAYDKMKEVNPEVRVLLSSGYSVEGEASEILARGCNGFIQKPFSAKQLSRTIRQVLNHQVDRPTK
ncbi:MAG: response regulator [Deltaproteobacteria bacterium]|nr:response regulator [Deltaproteobacteria bacterium]